VLPVKQAVGYRKLRTHRPLEPVVALRFSQGPHAQLAVRSSLFDTIVAAHVEYRHLKTRRGSPRLARHELTGMR
jgi:hypothetical protein